MTLLRKDLKRPYQKSLDPLEVAKFEATAKEWRKTDGAYRVVHAFNTCRLEWLMPQLKQRVEPKNFAGVSMLDAGCATGIVCEAFAKEGAKVTGIDVAERNIALATSCAGVANLPIDYRLATPEEVAAQSPRAYQIVTALEVVEHVLDVDAFLDGVFECAADTSTVVIATLNRTLIGWLIGIVMAEHILRWLPKGTHQWARFVTPAELDAAAARHGFCRTAQTGFTFNPLRWRWVVTRNLSVNYMLMFDRKPLVQAVAA